MIMLFFPQGCCACGEVLLRGEQIVCTKCLVELPKTNFHKIRQNMIEKVFWGRIYIERATAYLFFIKESRTQHLLHQLKYNGRSDIGIFLGKHFGESLMEEPDYANIDVIIPVPLHPDKLKKRGYNQSEMIAIGMSKSMKKPIDTTNLKRLVFTETQTKKSKIERWENVQNVFGAEFDNNINGKHVLLVDDVLTTGATIEGCVAALKKENPNVKISIATLAFAHN